MPNFQKMSSNESLLGIVSFLVVFISIVLSLCISSVLPNHWLDFDFCAKNETAEKASGRCKCGRAIFTTKYINCIPRVLIRRDDIEDVEHVCNSISTFPYLVSLNAPAYQDEKQERRFACSGIILSRTWVLVGSDCVQSPEEYQELALRAGSPYWSKGGAEYNLKAASRFTKNGPVALKVDPPFTFSTSVSAVELPRKGAYKKWQIAASPGWRKGVAEKNAKFSAGRWSTTPCPEHTCNTGEIRSDHICVEKTGGGALVTNKKYLIGFSIGACPGTDNKSNNFMDFQTDDFKNWFEFLVENSRKVAEENTEGLFSTRGPIKIYETMDCRREHWLDVIREATAVADTTTVVEKVINTECISGATIEKEPVTELITGDSETTNSEYVALDISSTEFISESSETIIYSTSPVGTSVVNTSPVGTSVVKTLPTSKSTTSPVSTVSLYPLFDNRKNEGTVHPVGTRELNNKTETEWKVLKR